MFVCCSNNKFGQVVVQYHNIILYRDKYNKQNEQVFGFLFFFLHDIIQNLIRLRLRLHRGLRGIGNTT